MATKDTSTTTPAKTVTPEQRLALQDVDTVHKLFGIVFRETKNDPSEENIARLNKTMAALGTRMESLGVLCMK